MFFSSTRHETDRKRRNNANYNIHYLKLERHKTQPPIRLQIATNNLHDFSLINQKIMHSNMFFSSRSDYKSHTNVWGIHLVRSCGVKSFCG